ncbi:hypothetical protein [Haloferax sp. DFSO52]|uniref:hypothetical protein n=1 Tax=Haloferax sp. DFSO52 TaxID=3388505 RepID=UPI003A8776A0
MSDPFGDLDAAMGDSTATSSKAEPATEPEPEPEDEPQESAAVEADPSPKEKPAFEFDETVHKALYVLEEVAAEFDDIITYDVERELTREHGLKNIKKSELHNAALSVVSEHPDLIVERVLEQRELDEE